MYSVLCTTNAQTRQERILGVHAPMGTAQRLQAGAPQPRVRIHMHVTLLGGSSRQVAKTAIQHLQHWPILAPLEH